MRGTNSLRVRRLAGSGELLQHVLAGEDVWVELFGHVLHQETIYEATVAVAAWMVEALHTRKLDARLIPVGKARDALAPARCLRLPI